jgi:hypothetical protein
MAGLVKNISEYCLGLKCEDRQGKEFLYCEENFAVKDCLGQETTSAPNLPSAETANDQGNTCIADVKDFEPDLKAIPAGMTCQEYLKQHNEWDTYCKSISKCGNRQGDESVKVLTHCENYVTVDDCSGQDGTDKELTTKPKGPKETGG